MKIKNKKNFMQLRKYSYIYDIKPLKSVPSFGNKK